MKITIPVFVEPENHKKPINCNWRDFAENIGIPLSSLLIFLSHVNFIRRIPNVGEQKASRIISTLQPCKMGLTETFMCKKNGKHFSQTKITPKGMKELRKLYSKEFKQIRQGIPLKQVIENSKSMAFILN